MSVFIWLALASFGLSLILTPVFRTIFRSCGVVDKPDQSRKIHGQAVPRAGGMAIATSYALSIFLVLWKTGAIGQHLALIWKILPAACMIFAVGIVDDIWGLKARQKLFGQFVAACIACWSGILVVNVAGVAVHDWWTIPVTIIWLLACSNAFNLVDGMDGLAAGVGIFATLTIAVAALLQNNTPLALATIPLAGCLFGFLRYNFNPATIFLGDSGSLLIGFLLGCYGIIWTEKSATLLGMTAPLMALSLPLLDVGLAIVRRFLRHQPIFSADRGHIHHRLLDRGMSPKKAVILLYGICSIVAVFSLLQTTVRDNAASSVIVLLFCTVAWIGIQYLEYTEFSVAGKMFFGGGLQRHVKSALALTRLHESIANAETAGDCAAVVRDAAGEFGLVVTRLRIAGEDFAGSPVPSHSHWDVRVTIADGDWVDLARIPGSGANANANAMSFLDALAIDLNARIPSLGGAHARTVVIRSMSRPVA
jgi:UDP-GlcNAc:undecaprenyl-phosphate GlcNAc-1-phosphate transferase